VKLLLGLLEQSKNSLNRIAKKLPLPEKQSVFDIGNSFADLSNRLDELLQMTSLITSAKSKIKPGRVALKSKVIKVLKVFELITKKYEIDVDYSNVANNIVIKNILEAELYSILLNVLSNSIKAVLAGGNQKEIKIIALSHSFGTKIVICDSGVGLDESRFEEVFIPFVSDPDGKLYDNLEKRINPEDSMIVGTGSGLGLGIVNEIVNARGGKIKFVRPNENWSTIIELELP